jgi:valyl-tRNA synthetase
MEKTFNPAEVEQRISAAWDKAEAFKAGRKPEAQPFTVMIPPPNVTGTLHMGHALNNTLQDILCRFERMRGRDVLWQVGTDHAGIATQMVVERKLAENGENRRDLGREKFLKRVWAWKEESGSAIINQLKRLGASCDWSREKFTMGENGAPDDQMVRAVTKVFVDLYNKGLIYKDKRLVNWDPHFQTAISDLEVVQVEKRGSFKWERDQVDKEGNAVPFDAAALEKVLKKDPHGHMYYINYLLEHVQQKCDAVLRPDMRQNKETGVVYNADDASTFITVATTRPETLLGDMAVAVHPENEKFKDLLVNRKNVVLPLVERLAFSVKDKDNVSGIVPRFIPIIGDTYADPEKGTGAVKITPAHDFNDFEVWKRYLEKEPTKREELRNIFDRKACIITRETENENRWDLTDATSSSGQVFYEEIPDNLRGLDRYAARLEVVKMLHEQNLLIKIEPTTQVVPHGDRSGVAVEPRLTHQWYVDAKTLAQPALEAVRNGKTKFVPQNWEKTYFQWLENIQPWCISRQLWWGHQIPVWYDKGGRKYVASSRDEAFRQFVTPIKKLLANYHATKNHLSDDVDRLEATAKLSKEINRLNLTYTNPPEECAQSLEEHICSLEQYMLKEPNKDNVYFRQDEDVLDTWFSSALWPFSTLGWPDSENQSGAKTENLVKRHYPTNTLVTGFDIIFFWVARMMMMSLEFMKDENGEGIVPFKDVYIHALVRDASGAKMSKSKGNVIDPLALIEQYGADALRFTMAAMAAQGRDLKLSTQRVEGYRNFATKIWNVARFAEMNDCARALDFNPASVRLTLNQWVLSEAAAAVEAITKAITEYRFNDAANAAYKFVWNTFCDWYVELAKPVLQTEAHTAEKAEIQATIAFVLDQICLMLHPFMPFITEELWDLRRNVGVARVALEGNPEDLLCLAPWPELSALHNSAAEAEIGWVVDVISSIRSARAEVRVPASVQVPLVLVNPAPEVQERLTTWGNMIQKLARISGFSEANTPPAQAMHLSVRGTELALPLADIIDLALERTRITKEIEKMQADVRGIEQKLGNSEFVRKAPEEVVEEQRDRLEELTALIAQYTHAHQRLG